MSRPARKTVLVVDDDPQAAKLLSLYLTRGGYRVVLSGSGEDALAQAATVRPDAITLDLLLPGESGWQVLHALKASRQTEGIPVVIVSVLDRQRLGFRLGAADHLVKPVRPDVLLGTLARCIRAKARERVVLVTDDALAPPDSILEALTRAGFDAGQAASLGEALDSRESGSTLLIVVTDASFRRAQPDWERLKGHAEATCMVLVAGDTPEQEKGRMAAMAHAIPVAPSSEAELLALIGAFFETPH
ncbi:MAG: response regulator [Betaproteobacteria bacterium]|nr:response regulator [Betaproteobacteria bacterium]